MKNKKQKKSLKVKLNKTIDKSLENLKYNQDLLKEFWTQEEVLKYSEKTKNTRFKLYNRIYFYLITIQMDEKDKTMIEEIKKAKNVYKEAIKLMIEKEIKQELVKENTKNDKDKTIYKNFKNNNVL